MDDFPNKILLATDGSEDAALAASAAIELSNRAASELHVVHAGQSVPFACFKPMIRVLLRQQAEELLAEQEKLIETQKRADAINGLAPLAGPGPTHRGHRASAFSPYGGKRPAR